MSSDNCTLRVGGDNTIISRNIHRADSAPITALTGSAFIFLTSDATRTPLANSSISLEEATINGKTVLKGVFPSTVSLTQGTSYTACISIFDGASGDPEDVVMTATRG